MRATFVAVGIWFAFGNYFNFFMVKFPVEIPSACIIRQVPEPCELIIFPFILPLTVEGLREGLDASEARWLFIMYAELTVPFIFAGAVVVLEIGADDPEPEVAGLEPADDRRYGETRILILRDAGASPLGGAAAAS